MNAVVQDPAGAVGILGPPVLGGAQVLHQDRSALHRTRGHGVGGDEADQLAGRGQQMVPLQADDGGAAHLGDRAGGLLTAQDRLQELDGDDVGEAGDRDLREFLSGARDIQGGPDPHAGVIEQLQPLARGRGPAGESLQFGGVPQRHHPARRALGSGESLVDGQEPVSRQMHLVGGRAIGREQPGEVGVQPQRAHVATFRILWQVQQPAGLVVGQQQPTVTPEDQHSFPYGVEDRVVMLVHPRHLDRAQAVGLLLEATAHQCRPRRRGRATRPRPRTGPAVAGSPGPARSPP